MRLFGAAKLAKKTVENCLEKLAVMVRIGLHILAFLFTPIDIHTYLLDRCTSDASTMCQRVGMCGKPGLCDWSVCLSSSALKSPDVDEF